MSRRINTPEPTSTETDRDLIGRARTLTPGEVPPAATEAKPEIRKMGFQLSSMALR